MEDRVVVGVSHTPTEEGGSGPVRQDPRPHSHFHVTGLLVVAEGAGELGLQGACHLLLGGWLPFRLSAPHVCRGVNLWAEGTEVSDSWAPCSPPARCPRKQVGCLWRREVLPEAPRGWAGRQLSALWGQEAWILTPAPPLPAGSQVGSLNSLCLSLLSMKGYEVSIRAWSHREGEQDIW